MLCRSWISFEALGVGKEAPFTFTSFSREILNAAENDAVFEGLTGPLRVSFDRLTARSTDITRKQVIQQLPSRVGTRGLSGASDVGQQISHYLFSRATHSVARRRDRGSMSSGAWPVYSCHRCGFEAVSQGSKVSARTVHTLRVKCHYNVVPDSRVCGRAQAWQVRSLERAKGSSCCQPPRMVIPSKARFQL